MTTDWDALPHTVKTFMTAIDDRDDKQALAMFTTDAAVTDNGHVHTGRDEIRAWLATDVSGSEFTYTSEFTDAITTDTGVDVGQHLEGDFPGGVADLRYRFELDGSLISRLVIEP